MVFLKVFLENQGPFAQIHCILERMIVPFPIRTSIKKVPQEICQKFHSYQKESASRNQD